MLQNPRTIRCRFDREGKSNWRGTKCNWWWPWWDRFEKYMNRQDTLSKKKLYVRTREARHCMDQGCWNRKADDEPYLSDFFLSPTTKPRTKATASTVTTKAMRTARFHPPLRFTWRFLRTSQSLTPLGPVASQRLYWGGDLSKLGLGGSSSTKVQCRLKGRWK